MPCLQQVVDLQNDPAFKDLGVKFLSIAGDPPGAWRDEAQSLGITAELLSDEGNKVASRYGVMRWKMPSNEPGHTFVLVEPDGTVGWIRDYGAPDHGGLMYVPPEDLVPQISAALVG
jgi:peroxiredoxin